MTTTIHMRLDVRGLLGQSKRDLRKWRGAITVNGRTLQTADEIREFLLDQLEQGRPYLPVGNCPGFDFKTGCPGHRKEVRDGR